jgi:hypothetical protein
MSLFKKIIFMDESPSHTADLINTSQADVVHHTKAPAYLQNVLKLNVFFVLLKQSPTTPSAITQKN